MTLILSRRSVRHRRNMNRNVPGPTTFLVESQRRRLAAVSQLKLLVLKTEKKGQPTTIQPKRDERKWNERRNGAE